MRRGYLAAFAVFGVAMAGCTTFDSIEQGVCGNGIIETGEDCDSSETGCVRCAVTCETQSDCPTAAYSCGADGVCAAPSGGLAAESPAGIFSVDDFVVTDLDRDQIGDVLGTSQTSLVVRFGDAVGRLDRIESRLTPSHAGPASYGDLDGDGSTDVALATADGMVAYGSKFNSVAPLSVRSTLNVEDGALDILSFYQVSSRALAAMVRDNDDGFIAVGILDAYSQSGPPPFPPFVAPCVGRLGLLQASQIPLDKVEIYQASNTDVVMSMIVETTPRAMCQLAFHLDTTNGAAREQFWTITDVTPTLAVVPAGKLTLADVDYDGDRCPGLLVNVPAANTTRYVDGSLTGGVCTFANTANGVALPDFPGEVVGRIPLSPSVGFVANDMLVAADGVYMRIAIPFVIADTWLSIYTSQRPLRGADFADFNRDGNVDGVLYAETGDDVDILYRQKNAADDRFPGYVVYRVDTTSRVSRTHVGDYNGDGLVDLGLVEELGDSAQISVAFGSAGYLAQPVRVATFDSVLQLVGAPFPSSEDQASITTDMLVLQPPTTGQSTTTVSILSGSTLGTLVPFFDPRDDDAPDAGGVPDRDRTLLATLVIGRFVSSTLGAVRDVVTFGTDVTEDRAPLMWRMPGTQFGPDATVSSPLSTTGFADCDLRAPTGLCVREARYLAWPTSATGTDVVFAVDRQATPHAVRFDPATTVVEAISIDSLAAALDGKAPVRALVRANLDADGEPELVVIAADAESSRPSGLVVCRVTNATPRDCADIMPALLASEAAQVAGARVCTDAVPARMRYRDRSTEPSPALDLVVACRTDEGSVLLRSDLTGSEVTELARTSSSILTLRAGDVTGDGLDDLLAVAGTRGGESLSVFRQCSSRDLLSCGGGQ